MTQLAPTTKKESITPAMAEEYLKKMPLNRPLSNCVVDAYAAEMRAGRWLMTHQGIAFDTDGNLFDGQHRLWAIIEANVTVDMMVTRNVEAVQEAGGFSLRPIDAVDAGYQRTLSQNLALSHGMKNSAYMAAACTMIAKICANSARAARRLSMPQTLAILEIYSPHIEPIFRNTHRFKPIHNSTFGGTAAFAHAVYPTEMEAFLEQVSTGAELAAGSPALALRNYVAETNGLAIVGRTKGIDRLSNAKISAIAMYHHVMNQTVRKLTIGDGGLAYFHVKQKENVKKVLAILDMRKEKARHR